MTARWLAAIGMFIQAGSDSNRKPHSAFADFQNPQTVRILGYSSDAMEPFISRDGSVLFFNGLNTAPTTNLDGASRIDDVTFQYQGQIGGAVNSSGPLNAVASMDSSGVFYFVTTRSYPNTIYSGSCTHGIVTPVNPVPGLAAPVGIALARNQVDGEYAVLIPYMVAPCLTGVSRCPSLRA